MKRLFLLMLAACHHYGIVDFTADRYTACPGDTVTLTWTVEGGAKLAVVKGTKTPSQDQITAAEQDVDSAHSEQFHIDETTTFVIRAVDANQAKDRWQASQPVDVPTADEPKLVTTSCTDTTCTGTFTMHTGSSAAQVTRISAPMMRQGGKLAPATIRVTHATLVSVPLSPGQDITTPVPAEGDWTLEAPSSDPPPGLQVTVHIACP